jgi:hypothetical protein
MKIRLQLRRQAAVEEHCLEPVRMTRVDLLSKPPVMKM